LEASTLPPTTAIDVQMVCPKVAPVATPTAFLWVASCIDDRSSSSVMKLDEETAGNFNLKRGKSNRTTTVVAI
jgi:hypothetical protein